MSYLGRSSEFGVRSRYIYTAAGSETSISGADDNNNSLSFTDGAYVDVYLNGVLLVPATDYNTTTVNTIGGLSALAANDVVEVVVYDVFNVADTVPASTGGTFSGNITATAFYGDGSNLTGLAASFDQLTDTTVSTSDPTTSSNPSATGHLWLNKTSGEVYVCTDATTNANVWTNVGEGTGSITPTYQASYLIIGGGGAGGSDNLGAGVGGYRGEGGGGAGGYRNSYASETSGGNSATETPLTFNLGVQYTVVVGAGGSPQSQTVGTAGSLSSISGSNISTITASGGGGGGINGDSGPASSGGSGGGEGGSGNVTGDHAGDGTAGQGFDGANQGSGGGGGGAGAAGSDGSSSYATGGGAGGDGLASSITGTAVTRAGGGGAGRGDGTENFNGGAGGGGSGADNAGFSSAWKAGDVNTGSGGGGSGGATSNGIVDGGTGGSGVVILRMPTAKYSGTTTGSPTVTTDGTDTILTFTSSGSYTA